METLEKLTAAFGISIAEFFEMAKMPEQEDAEPTTEPVVANGTTTEPNVTSEPTTTTRNNSTASSVPNNTSGAPEKTTGKAKPWYLVAG